MRSKNRVRAFTVVADFQVNGRDVRLPLIFDDLIEFAGTNRIARLARSNGGFATSCSGPLTQLQVTVTALKDPLKARKSVLLARERLMRLSASSPADATVRCRNIDIHVSDLTRDAPLLVVHLWFEGREEDVRHATQAGATALLAAMEAITGGQAHMQLPARCTSQRLIRAGVRVASAALVRGRYDGRRIGERIVQLHQLNSTVPSRARNHNVGILLGIASVMAATGGNWRMLDAGAHAWAARHGGYSTLAHWEMDAQGYLVGALTIPVSNHPGCGVCPANRHTDERHHAPVFEDADDLRGSAQVLAAFALAQSLAALRMQAIETMQTRPPTSSVAAIGVAASRIAVGAFTDAGAKE